MSRENEEYQNIRPGLDVAVIGMAGRFPGAKNIHEFWNNIKNGIESISFLSDRELEDSGVTPGEMAMPNYVRARGILEDFEYFDASFFGYSPKEAEKMGPQTKILHECAWHALEDAGYDPYSYGGAIGLYVGAQNNFYWQASIFLAGTGTPAERFNSLQLADKDHISTRISYKLNLTGPTFSMVTQCSTSLVAVHQACQGLLSAECEIALAGGISILLPHKTGYQYQEGMISSSDGHLRAFDARASGTVFGSGAGIVVLKLASDAVEDGDNIKAIIKSSFINNDGNRKVGYSAPSVEGESEAIKAAMKLAEVEPESISYIETHGTATSLGDYIEMEALKIAFETDKKNFCAIGSVKTNVGHLENAAGAAGLIKTVLAMQHKLIPPSLHFETPNPKIEFENSPFYVNVGLMEWKSNGYPLRAGVSNFGIGGTNAHLILEEAPGTEDRRQKTEDRGQSQGRGGVSPPGQSREYQLILLSARTGTALTQMALNLRDYLRENPGIELADAAYTLQVGRRKFRCRQAFVAADAAEAVRTLGHPAKSKTHKAASESKPLVIFMFPGQGSQYINMGLQLYEKEPILRDEMNRCFEILNTLTDYDIKEMIYPSDRSEESDRSDRSDRSDILINQTAIAQPLIFIFEYALARLLMSWGIKPNALIGHSIGEYAAACLAGVFSLEDALELVVLRGKLMQQMPGGAMASAALSPGELEPLLNEKLSLAAVNGPAHCVVSGPHEAIRSFEQLLLEKQYKSTRLHTSHAFHSSMMDPILVQFEETVSKFSLNKPVIPFISNLTGNWIAAEEVTNPAYWANHLRKTVYFSDGLSPLLEKDNSIFIEVGPGEVLSKLVKQHPHNNPGHFIINLLRHPKEEVDDNFFLLDRIGMLWRKGVNIDWSGFYMNEKRHRISLPTYPFDRRPFTMKGNPFQIAADKLSEGTLPREKLDFADWFYIPSWKRSGWSGSRRWQDLVPQSLLVFLDETGFGLKLVKELEKKGCRVTLARSGPTFSKTGNREYTVNPAKDSHYQSLFAELKNQGNIPGHILHLWGITGSSDKRLELDCIDQSQDLGFYSLLHMAQAIGKLDIGSYLRVMVVTNNMQEVIGEDQLNPLKATVLGAVRGIPLEYNNIRVRSIDILLPAAGSDGEEKVIRQLCKELVTETTEPVVAVRNNHRWLEIFEPLRLESSGGHASTLKDNGVYLVIGGLGGIGLALAEYLARQVSPVLVLVGRSPFPARERWDHWLTTHKEDDHVSRKIRKVQELEKLGAKVSVFSADVTNPQQMQDLVKQAERQLGKINGIIHSAGAADGTLIPLKTREVSEEILSAKVRGTVVLDTIFRDAELDFFILCSSLDSMITSPGQVSYCAANNFLDAFAKYRSQIRNTFTLSINWPRWEGVGIAVITEKLHKQLTGEDLPEGISTREGMEIFSRLLLDTQPRAAVSKQDLRTLIQRFGHLNASSVMEMFEETAEPGKMSQRPDIDTEYAAPTNETQQTLAHIWSRAFGFEQVGIHDDFFQLGGDSLKALIVTAKIHKELKIEVPIQEFFNRPTIEELSEYIHHHIERTDQGSIEPAEEKEYYELSSAQKRLYIVQLMDLKNTTYNLPTVVTLEGDINTGKIGSIFKQLIARHEALRTSFRTINGKGLQRVHREVEFEIRYYPPDPNPYASAVKNFIRPFDLSRAPLFRVGMIEMEQGKHILMADVHHIVADGISTDILVKEFIALYQGEDLPALRLEYKDFSEWQNKLLESKDIKKQDAFWLDKFKGNIPRLHMPLDYERPAVKSFAGDEIHLEIGKETTFKIKQLNKETGTTLFMVLLAVYNVLLHKYTGQTDIIVGSPISGRRQVDLQNLLGVFVNMIAFRNQPGPGKSFAAFLEEVKANAVEGYQNQDYPFEELVRKLGLQGETSRNPIFDVAFVQQQERDNEYITNTTLKDKAREDGLLKVTPYDAGNRVSRFDMLLDAVALKDKIVISLEYSTQLFKKSSVEIICKHFKEILQQVVEDKEMKLENITISSDLKVVKSDHINLDFGF
jgi:acyl transferase domain-containing protein/acyl carrier protein